MLAAPAEPQAAPPAVAQAARPPAPAGLDWPLLGGAPPDTFGGWRARLAGSWLTVLIAAILCFVAFVGGGGLNLGDMTTVETSLTIAAGVLIAGVALLGPRGRAYGGWPTALLLAFTALTALSVVWSVQPDDSFRDAGRMLAYSAVFAAAVLLPRVMAGRWPALLGGIALASVVVCGYALLTKVFPAQFDASDIYSRLRAPYSYWNAIGLTAAMGAIACMWLGARRAGHALLSALAYPAIGLMLLTLMLAYSRGALVALLLGLALWFCIVPLRLRGAALLLSGALGAGVVVAWDFSQQALSTDSVPLATRVSAGHQLGVLILAMLLLLVLLGLAFGFWTGRNAPSIISRRRAGAILLSLLAVMILAFAGALAASQRGFTGSISHDLHSLTDPHAPVPANTPGRLTAVGSVRARYWNEALKVFKAHPVLGAGAEGYATARLRYRTETLDVRHAHGYIIQTMADLGLVGLVLTLALLGAWMVAAGRATHPFNRRWSGWRSLGDWRSGARLRWEGVMVGGLPAPYTPERIGMLSMLCLVVVFGIHSLADWTWYVPGDAFVALLCAGWLAGRGPLETPAAGAAERWAPALPAQSLAAQRNGERAIARGPSIGQLRERLSPATLGGTRLALALAVLLGTGLAVWAEWQPERSANASQAALARLASNPQGARAAAQQAVSRDPLSAQALFTLSTVQQAAGSPALARATLERAVRLQPSNPQTWLTLGQYDLAKRPRAALQEIGAAIYLNPELVSPEAIATGNPESISTQNDYVQALRASQTPAANPASAVHRPARAGARGREQRARRLREEAALKAAPVR